jgi:hypothetical protein
MSLRGYLIRLTREYTDGGMDSHAEDEKRYCCECLTDTAISRSKLIFSANVRSAVRVFTGEAGQRNPCGSAGPLHLRKLAVFAVKQQTIFR